MAGWWEGMWDCAEELCRAAVGQKLDASVGEVEELGGDVAFPESGEAFVAENAR